MYFFIYFFWRGRWSSPSVWYFETNTVASLSWSEVSATEPSSLLSPTVTFSLSPSDTAESCCRTSDSPGDGQRFWLKTLEFSRKQKLNTLSFVIHQSLCIIPLQVIISKKAFLSFRPWISLAWDPSSERLNSDSLRLTRNLLFSLSKLVTLATTVWPMSKTVEVSVTNWSPMAYDEKQNQIYTKMYNFIQNPIQTTKTKTYSFRSEAEEPIREIDEDSIRHDVLHPADHLHPPLELREVFGDAVVLQTGLQQRFLSESLNRTRLRRTERCGSLSTWLHRYYLNWTELDNNITESMMSWL